MKTRWWALGWLILLASVAGCASPGPSYQGGIASGETYFSDVPSSFYGNDPMLRQWYTAPYWNPSIDH